MISIQYGGMPSFDDFESHLKSYVDEENELVAGNPPEVFWMEIPVDDSSDYTAFVTLYDSLNSDIQNQIDTDQSEIDSDCVAVVFTTYESLYEFLSLASQQWDYSDAMELASAIMDTIGYKWID